MMPNNPLLVNFDAVPFSTIKPEHFKPAIEVLIKKAKGRIESIANQEKEPTFENTLEALEFSALDLNSVSGIFFNLNAAETNKEIQELAQEISPILAEFANDVRLNEALFKRIKWLYEHLDKTELNQEQQRIHETN